MDDLAPYTYLLIFAVLALLNYIMKRMAKWLRQQQDQEAGKAVPTRQKAGQEVEALKRQRELRQQQRNDTQLPDDQPSGIRQRNDRVRRPRESLEEPPEVREARARAQRSRASAVPLPPQRVMPGVRSLLQGRQNLQQAIVVMTVLGPCRAQQPPDLR